MQDRREQKKDTRKYAPLLYTLDDDNESWQIYK